MFDLWSRLKSWIAGLVQSRALMLLLIFVATSGILVHRVFYLQIVRGQDYQDNYRLSIQKTKVVQGTRGRILDRNGVPIADNKLAYSVTIEDNGEYNSLKEKNQVINDTLTRVIEIVESHGDTIISNFNVVLGDTGEYEYTMDEGTQRLRFLADVYGYPTIDELSYEERETTAAGLIHYLCTDKTYGYGLDEAALDRETVLKMVTIRYAMSLNRFQKYMATTVASDVSEETTAAIMENMDDLQGVDIAEDSLRVYPDSKYFAPLIGYTGQISQEEYDAMDPSVKSRYSLTDVVGKAGLEQTLDTVLQGSKGEIKLYVNSVGRVIEMTQGKESQAGNDVVLTIDAELQKAAYDLLEEKLAGIVLAKLANVMNYDRTQCKDSADVIIPVDDAYFSFIENEILDTAHFEAEDAGDTEREVFAAYQTRRDEAIGEILEQLRDPNAPAYRDCSAEMQAYQTYVCGDLLTSAAKVLVRDRIDTDDATYKAWSTDDSISLYTYLNYAISQNWVDTSRLGDYLNGESDYTDLSEVYQAMVDLVGDRLVTDSDFEKLIFQYMIKTGRLTGRQVCLMLYEQGILKYDETQYQNLLSGAVGPYDFLRGKIETLEITPGQLGLEPCTGSVVVTDCNTGEVLACVSYPGFDNNRLANSMDSAYFSSLLHNDNSAPLYNNATQERTAPGSTYKPLVATAGLTEGVIDLGTYLSCTGTFDKITPSPKCWVYPDSHGSLDVEGAIQHSCNSFFFEVGYRLGTVEEEDEDGEKKTVYSSSAGTDVLKKYADLFGLTETTGIEIPENLPNVSDTDSVRSSIGQGTNNYTTTQLARYIAAVANKGTVFHLSLLDKAVTADGRTLEDYETTVRNKIEGVADSTWDAVHNGMRRVVTSSATYNSLNGFELSGKTGTAQQSTSHADHGLFVGFAPSSDPEIAFAIRIKNGYESQYASEVGRDLIRYYYGITPRDELITGSASAVQTQNVHGD